MTTDMRLTSVEIHDDTSSLGMISRGLHQKPPDQAVTATLRLTHPDGRGGAYLEVTPEEAHQYEVGTTLTLTLSPKEAATA